MGTNLPAIVPDLSVATVVPQLTVILKGEAFAMVDARENALIDAPAIVSAATLGEVRAVVKDTKKVWNEIEAARQLAKAPFLDACTKIDAAARPLLTRLTDVMNEGKRQEGEYLIERDRQLRADEELRRQAELLAMRDTSRPTAPLVAPTLPEVINAPLSQRREVKIVDPALVPAEYWILDVARIEREALGGKVIPGVTVSQISLVVAR